MKWGVRNSHKWHLRFAWMPTQMDNGEWIWLAPYVARIRYRMDGYDFFERILPKSLSLDSETDGDA